MLVKQLAELLGSSWEGDGDLKLERVAPLEDAAPTELSFVTPGRVPAKTIRSAAESRAGCLLVPPDFPNESGRTVIRVKHPRAAVARAIAQLHPKAMAVPGIHPTAVIGAGANIAPTASIGPFVSIGAHVTIGEGTRIDAGTTIGDQVQIGARCTIHARVTVYHDVTIGDDVVLHSGSVIGADGFGYVMTDGAWENFPQVGRVELGNRVEIGANACIDRAALGVTVIGEGTKLDNMVHVGHNCRIGKNVVVAAQTGFSGGVTVGDYAVIGGQVGVGDKVRIESRAVLGSGSGVLTSKIVRGGEVMWGTPARPLKDYLAQLAALNKIARRRKTGTADAPEEPSDEA